MMSHQRSFGFNFVGHVSGNFGLGVAARNTLAEMVKLGYPVAVVDVPGANGERGEDMSYSQLQLPRGVPLPYGVTLFHMNPIEIRVLLQTKPDWFAGGRTLNLAVPFWELPRIPVPWEPVLSGMDAVLAPTRFIGEAVHAALPGLPLLDFPQAVHVPEDVPPNRARFNIPERAIVCFIAFHTGSGVARKNPIAALEAYSQAFSADDDVALVVKMTTARPANPLAAREHELQVQQIRGLLAAVPNVIIIDEALSYRDVLSLYASCDILLSLHRSEGLGLHLMEAMALSRVVVSTGWSGVTDFLTPENSVEIGYDLVPVSTTPPVATSYSEKFVGYDLSWAEPHVEEAVAALRKLAAEPGLRAALGQKARRDMEARSSMVAEGDAFALTREMWERESMKPGFEGRVAAQRLSAQWRWSAKLASKNAVKRLLGRA